MHPSKHIADVANRIAGLELNGPGARGVALAQGLEEALNEGLLPHARDVADTVVEVHRPLSQKRQDTLQHRARRGVELGRRAFRHHRRSRSSALLGDPDEHPLVGRLQNLGCLMQDIHAGGLLTASVEHLPRIGADLLEASEGAEELLIQRPVPVLHELGIGLGEPEFGEELSEHLLFLLDDLGLVPKC